MYPVLQNWISITGLWYVIVALDEFNCYYSQHVERIPSCFLCQVFLSTTSLLIICGIILRDVWARGVGGRVFRSCWGEKKNPSCSGLIHVARFTFTAVPIEGELACTWAAWHWHSKIGSGLLLVNFHTLMLWVYPQTYACICKNPCKHTHTYSQAPHPLLIPLFSSLFRLFSSLTLPPWAAKLSPEQLNNQ